MTIIAGDRRRAGLAQESAAITTIIRMRIL